MLDNVQIPDEAVVKLVESGDEHLGGTFDLIVKPPAKELGLGLASVVRLVFSPFRALNSEFFKEKVKTFINELQEKRKKIPEDKLCEPDAYYLYTAVDNAKCCLTNEELRKMFVNLICNTMNLELNSYIHPSFAVIIKELSSIDAQILKKTIPRAFNSSCKI